jgi:hypothetical protein
MILSCAWPQVLDFFGTPLVLSPAADRLSSDAGLLTLRPFDQHLGLTRFFTDAFDGSAIPTLPSTTCLGLDRSRFHGIRAGNKDQIDHDCLGDDTMFKFLDNRSPNRRANGNQRKGNLIRPERLNRRVRRPHQPTHRAVCGT